MDAACGQLSDRWQFCFIEQVCGIGIGGPCTHAHPSDEGLYILEGHCTCQAASAEQTGGSYLLMEELCPLHGGPPLHTHRQDEAFYILEGEITLIAGEKKVTAKAGSLAYIPAGCLHSFRVEADQTRLLNYYFPGGFERVVTDSELQQRHSRFRPQT